MAWLGNPRAFLRIHDVVKNPSLAGEAFTVVRSEKRCMYRASDRVEQDAWVGKIEAAAETLDLGTQARSHAVDLFLSTLPDEDRSKRATMAASLYVGALVAGEERSQTAVADATDVSRLTIQQRWKDLIESFGLEAPDW